MSCNYDPEASLSLDQMEGREGQQGQLFILATVCVGLLSKGVNKLSVSGCGLVSSAAVMKMKLQDKIGQYWKHIIKSGVCLTGIKYLLSLVSDEMSSQHIR